MAYIRLTSVTFSPTPHIPQLVTIRVRLQDDPDPLNFVTVASGILVDMDGSFPFPGYFDITGLLDNEVYIVRVVPECGGASDDTSVVIGIPTTTTTTSTSTSTTITSTEAPTTTTSTSSTSTTTLAPTTTTSTTLAPIACGAETAFAGGSTFPTIQSVILGNFIGRVTLTYNAFNIPDKYIVNFDGVDVLNTGYAGSATYQSALDANLTGRSLPTEVISTPGSGFIFFDKATTTPNAIVSVYAPLPGTQWNFTLSCPTGGTIVRNNATGATITAVSDIVGYSFGNDPLLTGDPDRLGFGHLTFNDSIAVTVGGVITVNPSCLKLYADGVEIECLSVVTTGTFFFSVHNFTAAQEVKIVLQNGTC